MEEKFGEEKRRIFGLLLFLVDRELWIGNWIVKNNV